VDRVAEVELLGEGDEALGAILDDAAAGDQVERGDTQLDGVDADLCERPKVFA